MRKLLSVMLAAAMTASLLSGCGGSGKTETTTAAAGGETKAAESGTPENKTPDATNAPAAGEVTFDVWHSMEGSNGEAFEAMVKNFNETKGKELGLHANSVFQGSDTASKLKTLIQTSDVENMPDVCLVYGASLPVVASSANKVAIDDMYGQGSAAIKKEDINPSAVQTFTYQGKQLCMPFNSSTLLLYYNADAFKEAGLDPENPPATMDEITEACQKLTVTENGKVTRYGMNVVLDRYVMVNLIGNQGDGTYFGDNESGRAGLITKLTCGQELRNVYDAWEKLVATGGLKYNYDNQNEEFATGKNAMTLMSSARIGSVTKLTKDSGIDWRLTYLPDINASDKGGACIGGASLAMFDKGDDAKKMAAWEFIQYAASADTQAAWAMATGYLPINLGTKDIAEYKAYVEESAAVSLALEQFESSNPMVQEPVMMMQGSIDEIIKEASINICEGSMTAEEATNYVIEQCNQTFEDYNKANE